MDADYAALVADARYLGTRGDSGSRWNWAPAARVAALAALAGAAIGAAVRSLPAGALVAAGCAVAGALHAGLGRDPHGRWLWLPAVGASGVAALAGAGSGLAIGRFGDGVVVASAVYLVVRAVVLAWAARADGPSRAALWGAVSGALVSCLGAAVWLGLWGAIVGATIGPPAP